MDRRALAVLGLVTLVTLSGCALLTGDTLEFSATKATVSDSATAEAGYEEVSVEPRTINQSFTVADQERDVRVTNWVATYERDLVVGTTPAPGTVAVLSTPEISIAGQTLNPIGSMSDRELLDRLLEEEGGISDVTHDGTRTATVLGTETEVEMYQGTVEYEGQQVDVTIHLTRVNHGGDYVVALGLHPAAMNADQAGIDTMLTGIEHEEETQSGGY